VTTPIRLLLLSGIVLLGASVQWLTGMGFALVAVPALILLLGPAEGVALANCAAGAISVVGLAGGWRRVRPAAMVPLCAAAACTVPAGTWLTHRLPPPALLLTMGALGSRSRVHISSSETSSTWPTTHQMLPKGSLIRPPRCPKA
jgi:uncharacterized membrane protein YfcA